MAEIDFFLSHNKADADWTKALHLALRKRGASTFFAEESISLGEDIVTAISRGLQSCKYIVFVLSPRSVASAWVELEWTSGLHSDPTARTRILPVLKEDCEIPFLLRRLRFLDARTSSIDDIATSLMSSLPSTEPCPISEFQPRTLVNTPLQFGAAQYVNREADSRVEQILRSGVAVLIHGPRKIGKTSMLHQMVARETLRGARVIWLDLQGHVSQEPNSLLEGIGYTIAQQLGKQWLESSLPPAPRIRDLFAKGTSAEAGRTVLIVDELDVITHTPAGAVFGSVLRALLSDPTIHGLSCAAAVYWPPWMGKHVSGAGSPWWNIFRLIRLGFFNEDEVTNFCRFLDNGAEQYVNKLMEVTGGHPYLIALAGEEHLSRGNLAGFLSSSLTSKHQLYNIADVIVKAAVWGMPQLQALLLELGEGHPIPKASDREVLWLAGLVRDPEDNPPVVTGTVFREVIACMF